jgi:hypothetical protein
MVAACAFAANHGTPADTREAAEAIAQKGRSMDLVTPHFGRGEAWMRLSMTRMVRAIRALAMSNVRASACSDENRMLRLLRGL